MAYREALMTPQTYPRLPIHNEEPQSSSKEEKWGKKVPCINKVPCRNQADRCAGETGRE